ncbi:MAG TPA: NADP-dependent oxidoreductase [Aeromicrobium sp.]|nr:NADP-dependent oxidoreductase [Aeromicrobium sp.]HKY57052.1 NADP-dependent oxidoreductase [Aeromicrobium sp.]
MAKVAVATQYGGPESATLIDQPTPEPGSGEVRVTVRAAGVNPIDYKVYSGLFGENPDRLPIRLGFEAAGVIDAVGPDVTDFAVGDEVIGHPIPGASAEHVVAPASSFVRKPANIGWDEAAGLMLVGVTAVHALTVTDVKAGDTVLIHGAGGVGLAAVQLAVARGARPIVTASPAKHEDLRALGGEPVAYGDGLLERVRELAPDGIDAAFDTVGSQEALDVSLALVADRDRIATIANFVGGAEAGIKVLGGGPGADPGTEIRAAAKSELADLAAAGRFKVIVDRTFPLADVADAHAYQASGHATGKVVLIP